MKFPVKCPRNFIFSLLLLFSALFLYRCAGEGPPGGGPIDTDPPKIIATYPAPNTVNFADRRIVLEFNEYVETESVEQSVFISPFLGKLEFEWRGKRVEIHFSEQLRPATTYVVTVGTDVIDLRNRNRMERAFSLAFSTGASIDSGMISGRVYDEKPEGVMIFAYRFETLDPKPLDPSVEKPHYLTQTGKGGSFQLSHLALGSYRIFAVRDEYKNFLYDSGADQFGVYSRDVSIDEHHPSYVGVNFQLTKEDTTPPQLFSTSAMDKNHLVLRFSKPLNPDEFNPQKIAVTDTLSGEKLEVRDGFVDLQRPSSVVLLTADQDSARVYKLTVHEIVDTAGNLINPTLNVALFRGAASPDALAPALVYTTVADSARGVPLETRFEFRFNDVLNRSETERAISLLDSSGNAVEGSFWWKTSSAVQFIPRADLRSKEWYQLRLQLNRVADAQGNRGRDTLIVRWFETIDRRELGSIEGELHDETDGRKGPYVVEAVSVGPRGRATYQARLQQPGKFEIARLEEGPYLLRAFRDDNSDGKYSYGRPFPFQPSEIFSIYPDTLQVRARWPLQGAVIRLR